MQKLVAIIETITDVVSGHLQAWLVFFLMVMVLVEVLTRYLLQAPLAVADEMGGYVLVSITFIGLAYTWKQDGHVRVELVTNLLPARVRQGLRFVILLMATAFCVPMILGCYELLQDSLLFEARSGSWMRTPLVYPQSLLLIGSVLLFFQLVAEIIKAVRKFQTLKEEGQG